MWLKLYTASAGAFNAGVFAENALDNRAKSPQKPDIKSTGGCSQYQVNIKSISSCILVQPFPKRLFLVQP